MKQSGRLAIWFDLWLGERICKQVVHEKDEIWVAHLGTCPLYLYEVQLWAKCRPPALKLKLWRAWPRACSGEDATGNIGTCESGRLGTKL